MSPTLLALALACAPTPATPTPEAPDGTVPTAPVPEPSGPGTDTHASVAGPKTLQRLNTAEWGNTMRALFHSSLTPESAFPDDNIVEGFDNNADGLSTSPVLFELYEVGVDDFLDELFAIHDEHTSTITVRAEGAVHVGGYEVDYGWRFDDQGSLSITTAVDGDGEFEFRVLLSGPTGSEASIADVLLDDVLVGSVATTTEIVQYAFPVDLDGGIHTFTVSFANPPEGPVAPHSLVVGSLDIEGPLDPEVGHPIAWNAIVPCDPTVDDPRACATDTLVGFAERAWRRAITPNDEVLLMGIFDTAGTEWEEQLRTAMKYIVLAPDFSFRVEPTPTDVAVPLDGYAVATRLAYFLWSEGPDDALLAAAESGAILDPEIRAWHIDRMLADPRSEALVRNFAGQWLAIRQIEAVNPDPSLYPSFDESMRQGMVDEVEYLARQHLLGDRSMLGLLTSTDAWANAPLADLYGLSLPPDTESGLVSLQGTPRAGLLTTAGWLATRAHPDRPSTVLRGKWVLDNLMCSPVPPPPPEAGNLGPIEEDLVSIRSQEEAARGDAFCQACHSAMDPIGFTLHSFGSIGNFRATDEIGFPIDAHATVADTEVSSIVDYREMLVADPLVARCMVIKATTYALGRTLTDDEWMLVNELEDAFEASDYRFATLIRAIVDSPTFLARAPSVEVE